MKADVELKWLYILLGVVLLIATVSLTIEHYIDKSCVTSCLEQWKNPSECKEICK